MTRFNLTREHDELRSHRAPYSRSLIGRETREEIADALAGLIVGLDDAGKLAENPPELVPGMIFDWTEAEEYPREAPSNWRRYEVVGGIALVSHDELVTVYTGANAETASARALEVIKRAEVVARSERA